MKLQNVNDMRQSVFRKGNRGYIDEGQNKMRTLGGLEIEAYGGRRPIDSEHSSVGLIVE